MGTTPFVELVNVSKFFPGVKALSDVSVAFHPGKVHVLLGENGAGKSTLTKIISGVYTADKGSLLVNGEPKSYTNTRDALHDGISMIHQELSVIPDLTVAENIYLGREPLLGKTGLIDRKTMIESTRKLLDSFGVTISPTAMIRHLNNADKQMVEIARAVSQNSSLVIMDEPTSSLSDNEIQALFRVVEQLKKDNVAVIYISHRLQEIRQIGDTVTVLRDGTHVATVPLNEITEAEMITLMVGREMSQFYYKTDKEPSDTVVLKVDGFTRKGAFEDISFALRQGEILGIAGLIGAGRTEVFRAIFGADKIDSGKVDLFGKPVRINSPQTAIGMGIGLIPEDRRNQGLLLKKNIKENTSLASLEDHARSGFIDFGWERETAISYMTALKTKAPSEKSLAQNLSGGNQQKVVIAKWLAADVKILFMDEPTRGIDVNAKAEIYALMKDFVEQGGSIVMISSDLPEVIGVSQRILVMREGRISAELDGATATEEEIMKAASLSSETMGGMTE